MKSMLYHSWGQFKLVPKEMSTFNEINVLQYSYDRPTYKIVFDRVGPAVQVSLVPGMQ